MTAYGLNPAFCDPWSTLPLFANLIRRGQKVDADGCVKIGRGMPIGTAASDIIGCTIETSPDGLARARLMGPLEDAVVFPSDAFTRTFHKASLAALATFKPQVLRTLDWQRTNERTDWSQPRVAEGDLLQGTKRGMAIELQAKAANLLGSHLWWCAPPRYELDVATYELHLADMLLAIRDTSNKPPILEYGNELWNAGFPVHEALRRLVSGGVSGGGGPLGTPTTWQGAAAHEIALLKRVADRVFGIGGLLGQRPYYLFVGGQLTVPSHLDRILSALADLGVTPDIAGPALYVTPLKASMEEWAASGTVPTQEELKTSMFARLAEIERVPSPTGGLVMHDLIRKNHDVPYFACYEAGQSLIARTPQGPLPWRTAAIEAQRTEWMGDLYREIRRVAESAGVDLLCWYSAATDQEPTDPRLDVFGLLESTDLSKMLPKARAARGD